MIGMMTPISATRRAPACPAGSPVEADLAIGSRYVPGGSTVITPGARGSGLVNTYAAILGLPIRDTTGAYRLWRRSALEAIPSKILLQRVRVRHRAGVPGKLAGLP